MVLLVARVSVVALLTLAAGCYDPQVDDCTITCAAIDECADGQLCGADGFCAAPDVAGTCNPGVPTAVLTIRIEKKGRITVDNPVFACESTEGAGTTCMTAIPKTGWLDLHAIETDKEFERWTSTRCLGQPTTCRLLLGDATLEVSAKFR